ncbi:TIGR04222 domain-containing membrane protein [Streptomyces sp. NPDC002537]
MWAIPFLICAVLVATSAWRVRRALLEAQRLSAPGDLPARDLSLYGAAYLHGGSARAATTAFVAMRLDGRLILSRSGTVTATDPTPRNAVEAAIIDATGATRQRKLTELSRAVISSTAIHAIRERLLRQGLLPRPEHTGFSRKLTKSRAAHGWMLMVPLVVGMVTVPLAAKTGDGGLPSLLAFLLLLALGSVPLIHYRPPGPDRATKAGRELLASLRGDDSRQPGDEGLGTEATTALRPFALGSTDHVPGLSDDEVRDLLREFGTGPTSYRRSAASTGTTAATGLAAAGYASGFTPSSGGGCGTGSGHDGGHSGCGGHGGCGGCGGGCGGCGCGG